MSFHDAATPDDLPERHTGDYDGPNCGYAIYGEPCICTCGTCEVNDATDEGDDDDEE
jgi:hypothetical protein